MRDGVHVMGAPGRISILKGTARQVHTEACRTRMEKEMAGEGTTVEAERRRDEYVEKAIAKDEVKRQKRKNDENEQGVDVKKDSGGVEMNKGDEGRRQMQRGRPKTRAAKTE